jgi:hypothetical protein
MQEESYSGIVFRLSKFKASLVETPWFTPFTPH